MTLRHGTVAGNRQVFLHLFLVVGVFVYLYSPFLDHWLGTEVHARPHTHTAVGTMFSVGTQFHANRLTLDTASTAEDAHNHEHEESVLCFLDIDALLAILLVLDASATHRMLPHSPLVFELEPVYRLVATIHLPVSTPPPIL